MQRLPVRWWGWWILVGSALLVVAAAFGAGPHDAPDQTVQRQIWFGDHLQGSLVSGCRPASSVSTTLAAFACTGYTVASDGRLVYSAQEARAVGPLSDGDGTYWLALHEGTSSTVTGWTRQSATHYLWKQSAQQPASPAGGLVFARVVVAAGASTVFPLGVFRPQLLGSRTVSVEDFGAVCDGHAADDAGTDDTRPLAEALAHLAAQGGTLVFPPRICLTTQSLVLTGLHGAVLQGAGAAQRNEGMTGSWVKLIGAGGLSGLLYSGGGTTMLEVRGLGFDANTKATQVLFMENGAGPISWVTFRQVVMERPVSTTGNVVLLGGAINSEIDWVTFDACQLFGDSVVPANTAATIIKLANSNTLFIDVLRSYISGAANLLYAATGGFGKIDGNIFANFGSNAVVITFQLGTLVRDNYTEQGTQTFLTMFTGAPLAGGGPLRIEGNIMRVGTTAVAMNGCYPVTLSDNQIVGAVVFSSPVECELYRVSARNNQFSGPGMVIGGGFTGIGAGRVDEWNTTYYNTTTSTKTQYTKFSNGLVLGSGATIITFHAAATYSLSIAAPTTVPGCADSAEQSLIGAFTAGYHVSGSLTDKVLSDTSPGQITVYVSNSGKIRFRYCQFLGPAVSPDGGAGGSYTAHIWGFQ